MDSNIEVSDDHHIIQITPTLDHSTPNHSHEQTPIATSTNSPAPKHESRGVNEMTPEELSSLKEDLRTHLLQDEWLESKSIIDKCPDLIRIPLNAPGDTALHVAASRGSLEIVKELVKRMKPEDMLIPNSIGNTALHLAADRGSLEIVKELIKLMRPEDMNREFKDPKNGRNLLHLVVLFRQKRIVNTIPRTLEEHIVREVDNEGNNILHLAAHLPPVEFEDLSSLSARIKMQRELRWFKFVESNVPGELRTRRNKRGKRPIDVFCEEHKTLSQEIKEKAKGIAEYGMLVSTLVATVSFAAALTVPGNKTNVWFTVFILTNAVALFASSASLLSFLTNFTSSRFAQSKFVISLHPSLTFGLWLLDIAVAAMVVAFTAASFLIFEHTSKWVSYAVASMGLFPILLFILFQYKFFDKHLWSRFYRLSKLD